MNFPYEPFNFFAIVYNPKDRNLHTEQGLMTPNYMLDHNKTDLLDDVLDPWRRVVTNIWGMYNTIEPMTLTRREIIDAINIKLGPEFMSSIYLYRYVPSPSLGWQLKMVLSKSAFYRMDLDKQELINYIGRENIDWGHDVAIFKRKLDKMYWQKVKYDEYVSRYRDGLNVESKSRLLNQFNQVRVSPPSGIIPNKFIEDMTSKLKLGFFAPERVGVY